MSNRWLRFVIAILALVASGAAGYRIFRQELRLASEVAAARAAEHAAHSSLATIAEIKAALHAYVAAGQGHQFWMTRAAMLIDQLRGSMLELDRVATSDGASLTDALDLSDRVAASEQRARDYVVAEQPLLAGDVIFTEGRDLLDLLKDHISRAQAQIAAGSATRHAELRREQAILAAGVVGVLALAILLLAPGAGRSIAAGPLAEEPGPVVRAPQPTRVVSTPRELPQASDRAAAPPARALSWREAADVCTDLGRVADSTEISALLARASSVLNASGIIVWVASPDLRELYPAASAGYDERVVSRIGSIPRDAANVTASAFRHAAAKTSASLGASPAALAVPLLTPLGATGVFSAELREGSSEVEPQQLALARIFAAQLAALLGSMATATEAAPPAQQAQA